MIKNPKCFYPSIILAAFAIGVGVNIFFGSVLDPTVRWLIAMGGGALVGWVVDKNCSRMANNKSINWIWPKIADLETAKRAARLGFWVAILGAVITTVFAVFKILDSNLWNLIDAAIFALIAWGIHKMSRFAAMAGLTFYLIEKIDILLTFELQQLPLIAIFTLLYIHSVRGTFAYHKFTTSRPKSDKKMVMKKILLILSSFVVVVLIVIVTGVVSFFGTVVSSVDIADGKIVSGSWDKTIKVWDLETEKLLNTLKGHSDLVSSVDIADGKIVSGSLDKTIKVWDLNTGKMLNTLKGHSEGVLTVVISDGRIISGSLDKTIRVWDLETGEILNTLKGHSEGVRSVVIADEKIIAGSNDNIIKVWDLETGEILNTIKGHSGSINSVAVSDGRIISGSDDGTIKVWDLKTGRLFNTLTMQSVFGLSAPVSSLTIDSKKIISACSLAIIVWDLETGRLLNTLVEHKQTIRSVAVADGKIISGSNDGTIKIWNLEEGTLITTLDNCPPLRLCL